VKAILQQGTVLDEHAQRRELLYAGIIGASDDAFIVLDELCSITDWSPQAEKMTGLTAASVLGQNFITTLIAPELVADTLHQFAQFKAGHGSRLIGQKYRTQMRRHDDLIIPVEIWLTAIDLQDNRHYCGFIRDLTDVIQREHELLVAQKMEAIGQMTGGLAHDFNNLLSIITGNLGLATLSSDPSCTAKFIDTAMQAAQSAAEITKSLMDFSRSSPVQPVQVDVNVLLQNLQPLIQQSAGKKTRVTLSANALNPSATLDVSGFNNAILNLVINARDAMPEGGDLHLYTYSQRINYTNALQSFSLPEGDYVIVGIDDAGEGMAPEVASRAFEPFFTTKESGRGTGLGLAMVYAFCRQSGGAAQLYSKQGVGTSIQLILPALSAHSSRELQS
jgi:PAS domain S-box-containing protein